MTRKWVDDHKKKPVDKRWVMHCDYGDGVRGAERCTARSEPFNQQPPLALFVERGWFVAKGAGDRCPACFALGRHHGIEPSPLMTQGDTEIVIKPPRETVHAAH